MSPHAALSVHLGSPYFHAERVAGLLGDLRAAFAVVRTMSTFVPLYGSLWMMATASDTLDPAALDRRHARRTPRRAPNRLAEALRPGHARRTVFGIAVRAR